MSNILHWVMYGVAITLALFLFFAVLGAVRDKYSKDHPLFKALMIPFALCDVAYNVSIMAILCLEPSKGLETVTARFKRYVRMNPDNKLDRYRRRVALWFCVSLIEKIDPGHCK